MVFIGTLIPTPCGIIMRFLILMHTITSLQGYIIFLSLQHMRTSTCSSDIDSGLCPLVVIALKEYEQAWGKQWTYHMHILYLTESIIGNMHIVCDDMIT